MKRRRTGVLASLGMVMIVLGLLFYLTPIKSPHNQVISVGPSQGVWINPSFGEGERVEGYFTVTRGNKEVEFTIEDPFGVVIYNAGTVNSRDDFVFTAEHEGVYAFFFGNSQSSSGKTVFLTMQTTLIGGLRDRGLWLLLAGAGALILILSLFGLFYEMKMKQGRKPETQAVPSPSDRTSYNASKTDRSTNITLGLDRSILREWQHARNFLRRRSIRSRTPYS